MNFVEMTHQVPLLGECFGTGGTRVSNLVVFGCNMQFQITFIDEFFWADLTFELHFPRVSLQVVVLIWLFWKLLATEVAFDGTVHLVHLPMFLHGNGCLEIFFAPRALVMFLVQMMQLVGLKVRFALELFFAEIDAALELPGFSNRLPRLHIRVCQQMSLQITFDWEQFLTFWTFVLGLHFLVDVVLVVIALPLVEEYLGAREAAFVENVRPLQLLPVHVRVGVRFALRLLLELSPTNLTWK
jgi:hypothetical protein